MAAFSVLGVNSFGINRFLKAISLLEKNVGYCWLKALRYLNLEQLYLIVKEEHSIISKEKLLKYCVEYGFGNFRVQSVVDNVVHIDFEKNFSSGLHMFFWFSDRVYFGAYSQVGRDAMYSITNVTKKDCIGFEAASGALGEYSTKMVKNALIVPYSCTADQQEMIRSAIPDRFILFQQPGIRVSHAPLKFLTEFLDESVMALDYTDKRIRLIGPKFDKKEVEAFGNAKSVHYCTKNPLKYDNTRRESSTNSLKRKIRTALAQIEDLDKQIENLHKEQSKKPGSNYVIEISDKVLSLIETKENIKANMLDYEEEIEAINAQEDYKSEKICNMGAEVCNSPCDVMVAMHSIYDIKIKSLLEKAKEVGAKELIATVILPFGLLYANQYYSDELDVNFYRKDKGFMMVHGSDLSNGYVHDQSVSIMRLMKDSVVKVGDEYWNYEIVDSIAEICKLRFIKANKDFKIVRKLMPKKFNDYSVIMNPLDYFGFVPKLNPIIVPKAKFESAIKYVKRAKNTKDLIEDTYSTVQALFMRVVVGNTELQAGGSVSSDLEDALVLAAIIEGRIRKHLLGVAYKKANADWSILKKVFDSIKDFVKGMIQDIVPESWFNYFTMYNTQRYIQHRIDFSDLYLYTDLSTHRALNTYLENFVEDTKDQWYDSEKALNYFKKNWAGKDFFYKLPTLQDIIEKHEVVFSNFEKADERGKVEMLKKILNTNSTIKSSGEILRRKVKKRRKQIEFNCRRLLNQLENDVETAYEKNIKLENEELQRLALIEVESNVAEELVSGSNESLDGTVVEPVSNELISVDIPFGSHDERSTEHINHEMDDLSKAALNFNMKRASDLRNGVKMTEKEIEAAIKKFTKAGEYSQPIVSVEEATKHIEILKDGYAVDASTTTNEILKKLKGNVLKAVKRVLADGSIEMIPTKVLKIVNGYAGAGKTRMILQDFNVTTDSYLSPLAGILTAFNKDLKEKKSEEMKMSKRDDMLKTFEKIDEIKKNGRVLYIDESSKFSFGFLLFILAFTNYESYVLVGDCEQSRFFDQTGMESKKTFVNLVEDKSVWKLFYSFRFGPTVAAFNNVTFNYPVFSLKDTDTKLSFHNIEDLNAETEGTNVTITAETGDWLKDDLSATTSKTAVASQGLTLPRANFVLRGGDIHAAVNFRSNGIVASTRATEELAIYIDYTSKRTKATKNFEILKENYANMFEIVLPNQSDF